MAELKQTSSPTVFYKFINLVDLEIKGKGKNGEEFTISFVDKKGEQPDGTEELQNGYFILNGNFIKSHLVREIILPKLSYEYDGNVTIEISHFQD